MDEVNLGWPAAASLRFSLWFSDSLTFWVFQLGFLACCCDLLPAARAQMQFPFSIFYMHIKRLFTFQFPASSLALHISPTCYKHIKINILQVAQKTAKDSKQELELEQEQSGRAKGAPLLWATLGVWVREGQGCWHSVQIQMCAAKCMRVQCCSVLVETSIVGESWRETGLF